MILHEFQVFHFRNVVDSGPIAADEKVTCLVGKNESGKTALLSALYRLESVYAAEFQISEHYPRWRLAPDRRAGDIEGTVATRAEFLLQDADVEAVEARFGQGVLSSTESVTVTVGYECPRLMEFDIVERGFIEHVLDNILGEGDALRDRFAKVDTLVEFQALLTELETEATPSEGEASASVAVQVGHLRTEVAELGDEDALRDAVASLLFQRLPRFFYFSTTARSLGELISRT